MSRARAKRNSISGDNLRLGDGLWRKFKQGAGAAMSRIEVLTAAFMTAVLSLPARAEIYTDRPAMLIGPQHAYGGTLLLYWHCVRTKDETECDDFIKGARSVLERWNQCLDDISDRDTELPWPAALDDHWYLAQLAYRADATEVSFGLASCRLISNSCLRGNRPPMCN